jgi:protein-tyrosine-phosphatase
MQKPLKILFVCRANLCRSVMAEGIAKKLAKWDKAEIKSAGTEAENGLQAADIAITVADADPDGAYLRDHRSRRLTAELVDWADIIYLPTKRRRMQVEQMFPAASEKLRMIDERRDFPDPIDADVRVFYDLYAQLKIAIKERFAELGLL